jgi:hypothetical protein
LSEHRNTIAEAQFQEPSVIPFLQPSQSTEGDDLHLGVMHLAQAKLHFCRELQKRRKGEIRRILTMLIDGQDHAMQSVQHIRNGRLTL